MCVGHIGRLCCLTIVLVTYTLVITFICICGADLSRDDVVWIGMHMDVHWKAGGAWSSIASLSMAMLYCADGTCKCIQHCNNVKQLTSNNTKCDVLVGTRFRSVTRKASHCQAMLECGYICKQRS